MCEFRTLSAPHSGVGHVTCNTYTASNILEGKTNDDCLRLKAHDPEAGYETLTQHKITI